MVTNFYSKQAASEWLKTVAPIAVAAFFSTATYAQDAPSKPANLQAAQENGYVTLTWDRVAKADTLLSDGFEGDGFPAEGGQIKTTNTYDPTFTWFQFPTDNMKADMDEEELQSWRYSGSRSAIVQMDYSEEHEDGSSVWQNEWLVLPATKGAQYLNFYTRINSQIIEYGQYEDFPDHYYVKVSHDGGETWKPIWDARYDSNGSDDWQPVSLYLGDASEGDVIVAFQAVGDDKEQPLYFTWAIDNVCLYSDAADVAAGTSRKASRNLSTTLASMPSYRPFASTGKKVSRPVRSAYKVTVPADTYTILLDDEVLAENVKSTTFIDRSDKTPGEHKYGVRAVNGDAVSETAETIVDVKAPEANAPQNVKVTVTKNESTGKYDVTMTWDAPEGTRQPSHYECYANGAMFAGWVDPEGEDGVLSAGQTGVNRGVQYYAVKAVYENPDGESELVGDLVAMGTRNTVSDVKADIDEENATAHVTWNAPKLSEYDVDKYVVFRGGKQIGETQSTEFTDVDIPEGTYEYNVKTVYADGVVSLPMAVEASYGEEPIYDVPFSENFDSGLKPADWTVERINESMKTDYVWRFDNWFELPVVGGGFEGNFASICSSASPLVNMYSALETPCIYAEPKDGEKVVLEFDIDYSTVTKATGKKSNAGLKYSFNKEDWADACEAFAGYDAETLAEGETCKPQHMVVDITSCFSEECPVYFAWYYDAKKAQHIAIDNVKIYYADPTGVKIMENNEVNDNAPVYNLEGQRVAYGVHALKSGIYVQRGRKFVVK